MFIHNALIMSNFLLDTYAGWIRLFFFCPTALNHNANLDQYQICRQSSGFHRVSIAPPHCVCVHERRFYTVHAVLNIYQKILPDSVQQ